MAYKPIYFPGTDRVMAEYEPTHDMLRFTWRGELATVRMADLRPQRDGEDEDKEDESDG